VHPDASDVCDGVDNDCDGSVDEDHANSVTSCGVGACEATGVLECVAGALVADCQPGTPAAVDAVCDGVDDDCDGSVDEDFPLQSCATGQPGICGPGTTRCEGGLEFCGADQLPVPEICDDGLDNDCDGATDFPDDLSCTETTSLSIRVTTGEDDVEERTSSGGSISLTSNDLELTEDGALLQVVGLRFRNVSIPPQAHIVDARIQFTADETHSVATSLTVGGEASDDAPAFVKVDENVTSRLLTPSTVSWDPPPWTSIGDAGPDQRTPNLAAIVQEVVDRPGWAGGGAMVFVISGPGHRTAEAYDGVPDRAAVLEVEYSLFCDADGDGYSCAVDCNDADASVHPGAIDLCDAADNDCDGTVDEDFAPQSCGTGDPGICASGITSCEAGAELCEPDQLPMAEICDDGLDNDCDGATDYPDDASCTPDSISIPILTSEDDAEERTSSGGSVSLTSHDLELTEDAALQQVVGLRFRNVGIPPNASIVGARIQFTTDEIQSVATGLTVEGEASDDAALFVKVDGNLTSRLRSAGTVSWNPAPWLDVGEAGAEQRTPELTTMVQEIVDRPGWAAGNAMVFLISGSGHRTAEAYDGMPARAAVLEIDYVASTP
jgi:hypothetical protein